MVVQADELLGLSTVVVCPTSTSAPAASFHPMITVEDQPTRVLCEMVGAVDSRSLGDSAGHLTFSELQGVADALGLVLGLA